VYQLEVLREGTAATAYVNGEAALSFRMYDLPAGNLGLFSLGKAAFSDIELRTDHAEP
jgi:beta-fructofuranosidase